MEKGCISTFSEEQSKQYNVPLVKTQMKEIIVTAKTLYSHPKNVRACVHRRFKSVAA